MIIFSTRRGGELPYIGCDGGDDGDGAGNDDDGGDGAGELLKHGGDGDDGGGDDIGPPGRHQRLPPYAARGRRHLH